MVYFRALSDRKRLLIVRYLARHDESTVTELGKELRLSQPLISWHLRLLRKAGIVKTRKKGRLVWCSLDRKVLKAYEQKLDQLLGLDGPAVEDNGVNGSRSLEPATKSRD